MLINKIHLNDSQRVYKLTSEVNSQDFMRTRHECWSNNSTSMPSDVTMPSYHSTLYVNFTLRSSHYEMTDSSFEFSSFNLLTSFQTDSDVTSDEVGDFLLFETFRTLFSTYYSDSTICLHNETTYQPNSLTSYPLLRESPFYIYDIPAIPARIMVIANPIIRGTTSTILLGEVWFQRAHTRQRFLSPTTPLTTVTRDSPTLRCATISCRGLNTS